MKFKPDENFGRRTVSIFNNAGHDVQTVHNQGLSGCDDQTIFQRCSDENRGLVTLDLDFSDVLQFPPETASGIIVLRLPQNPSLSVIEKMIL